MSSSTKVTLLCSVVALVSGWLAHALVAQPHVTGMPDSSESARVSLPADERVDHERERSAALRGLSGSHTSEELVRLRRENEELRGDLAQAKDALVGLRAEVAGEFFHPAEPGGEEDGTALEALNWPALGETVADMVGRAPELTTGKASQERRRKYGELSMRFHQATGALAERGWPSSSSQIGDVLAHPEFLVRLMRATLSAAGADLTKEQDEVLDELAASSVADLTRRQEGHNVETLALDKLLDQASVLRAFYAEVDPLLSEEQHEVLHPRQIRGRIDFDRFYAGAMWSPYRHNVYADAASMPDRIALQLRFRARGIDAKLAHDLAGEFMDLVNGALRKAYEEAGPSGQREVFMKIYHDPILLVRATRDMYLRVIEASPEEVAKSVRTSPRFFMPFMVPASPSADDD